MLDLTFEGTLVWLSASCGTAVLRVRRFGLNAKQLLLQAAAAAREEEEEQENEAQGANPSGQSCISGLAQPWTRAA